MLQEITLVFPSLDSLYDFVREFTVNYVDLESKTRTLTCKSDEHEIKVAEEKYKARLVNR